MTSDKTIDHLRAQLEMVGDELAQHIEGESPDFEFMLVGGLALHAECGLWMPRVEDDEVQMCADCHDSVCDRCNTPYQAGDEDSGVCDDCTDEVLA